MKSHVPEFHVFIGCSLDGYIATGEDGLDWLTSLGRNEDHGYDVFIAEMDVIVMGRRTYEQGLRLPEWPHRLPVVVLSTTLSEADVRRRIGDGARVMDGEPAAVARRLAKRGVGAVYVDGGETVRRFLAAGLVDTMTITRAPRILGSGRPLFGPPVGDTALIHLQTVDFASGLVQSTYRLGG